jgi:hypothetical protein
MRGLGTEFDTEDAAYDQGDAQTQCPGRPEEIFGPVLTVIPYTTDDEAIALANDSEFGLGGSIWTSDPERGLAMARRVRTGGLLPQTGDGADTAEGVLAMARHFAAHRSFYRAMLTGSCAYAMTKTLDSLFSSLNRQALREQFGELDETTAQDLAAFVAGGTGAVVNDWLSTARTLAPEEVAHRLLRLWALFAGSGTVRTDRGRDQ